MKQVPKKKKRGKVSCVRKERGPGALGWSKKTSKTQQRKEHPGILGRTYLLSSLQKKRRTHEKVAGTGKGTGGKKGEAGKSLAKRRGGNFSTPPKEGPVSDISGVGGGDGEKKRRGPTKRSEAESLSLVRKRRQKKTKDHFKAKKR